MLEISQSYSSDLQISDTLHRHVLGMRNTAFVPARVCFLLRRGTHSLPLASQRAAAFAGIARSTGTTTVADDRPEDELHNSVNFDDPASLMNSAERVAHLIQEPIDAAFVWLQIARTWNLLGKTQRYRQAIANLDDRLFDAWTGVWENRPTGKTLLQRRVHRR